MNQREQLIVNLSTILPKYFDPKPIIDGASAYQAADLVLTRLESLLKNNNVELQVLDNKDKVGG